MSRIPGVYVSIEDRSYIESAPNVGRNGLICIMSDRGPHNQVNTLSTNSELINIYGKPNFEKTGPGHYMASQFLNGSSNLHIIRPALISSPNPVNNCSMANAVVKYIPDTGTEEPLPGRFVFINATDALGAFGSSFVSQYVFTDYIGYINTSIGDIISNQRDGSINSLEVEAKGRIESVGDTTLNYVYWIKLSDQYTGLSTVSESNVTLVSLNGVDPDNIQEFSANPFSLSNDRATKYFSGPVLNGIFGFSFVTGGNVVYAETLEGFNSVSIEEWIYLDSQDSSSARQISSKRIEEDEVGSPVYAIYLDDIYNGESSVGYEQIRVYRSIELVSFPLITSKRDFSQSNPNNLFYFYAKGVGEFYNKISIQGVRNVALERMYTDDSGEPLYKYAFLDITIYGENEDGSSTILEGPWSCSLIDKVGEQVVRDLNSGRELFITKTINARSKFIECSTGSNTSVLEGIGYDKDQLRLRVMALFSVAFVAKTSTRGYEGFYLQSGSNGIQYDQWGRLNINHPEIKQLLISAYNCSLQSEDGSIELLLHTVYPWYQIDYVTAAGYDVDVQNAARVLVDSRTDCLLLADTGPSINAEEDITVRKNLMNWNTFNAAIYCQYREIVDPFNGRLITMSPVYHAIQNHLNVDNNYFISEPVAGITKASIQDRVNLMYKPSLTDMQNMVEHELNPVITEPDGTYLITQFTAYKRLSVLKRIHAVKLIHYIKKNIPKLLKGLLQQRPSDYRVSVGRSIVTTFMNQFVDASSNKYSFTSYDSNLVFDEERSEIFVSLTVRPIRAIEAININLIVI